MDENEKKVEIEKLWWSCLNDIIFSKGLTNKDIVEKYNKKYCKGENPDKITVAILKNYLYCYREPSALRFIRICKIIEVLVLDVFFNDLVIKRCSDLFNHICIDNSENINIQISNIKNNEILIKLIFQNEITNYRRNIAWEEIKVFLHFNKSRNLDASLLYKYKNKQRTMNVYTFFLLILVNFKIVTDSP